jgi:ribosomal protein S14
MRKPMRRHRTADPGSSWKKTNIGGPKTKIRPCLRCGKDTETTIEFRLCRSCRDLAKTCADMSCQLVDDGRKHAGHGH